MFKAQSQRMHEALFGGAVSPVLLPEPSYQRFEPLPEPNDPSNFGPGVGQADFGGADERQQHADAILDTVPIRSLLGRCITRLSKLQGLAFISDAEKRLAPLREAIGTAFGLAEVEEQLMAEFTDAVEAQHESVLEAGKKQAKKLAKLREELVGCDTAFENAKEATAAAERELQMRRAESVERWATAKDRKKREHELAEVQKLIDALRAATSQAVSTFNAKQEECEACEAELVEIDRSERRLRAMLDGDTFAVDPEFGLSRANGTAPLVRGFERAL